MNKTIRFKGKPVTLLGRSIKTGVAASDFTVTSQQLEEVTLKDFTGKIKIVTSFPSLDTPVCDLQVKEFNKKAVGFGDEVSVVGISKDLPFAQQRFCEAFDIKNIAVLSDYKTSSFGINYGLLIKELNLLARSIIIIDKNDTIRYIQVVDELTSPPDYADALKNLEEVIKNPVSSPKEQPLGHCKPCEGGVKAFSKEKIEKLIAKTRGWEVKEDRKITKEFKFKDFTEAKSFLDLVAAIAQEQGHHPTMVLTYNKVKVTLTTHAAQGLTENDFIMARIIDETI